MSHPNQQPINFIKSLQMIHFALIFGVLTFGAVVLYISKEKLFFSYQDGKAYLYLAIIISFIGNVASKSLYKKLINQIPTDAAFIQKGTRYTTAHIVRLALLEFPAMLCIIFVMLFNNSFYFILVGILVIIMLTLYPSKNNFENDVPLSSKEKSMLEKL